MEKEEIINPTEVKVEESIKPNRKKINTFLMIFFLVLSGSVLAIVVGGKISSPIKFNPKAETPSQPSPNCRTVVNITANPTSVPALPLCSQIGADYEWKNCSNVADEGLPSRSGCYNNICYTEIHSTLNTASDCSGTTPYCRYYNYETCGTKTCVSPSGSTPCSCINITLTPTPIKKDLCEQCAGTYDCQTGFGCWPCGSATLSKCAVSSCNECITPTP